jgi:hypothetical protein
VFVVQIQIPSEPPPSIFSTVEDGPGWAIVMYFKITEDPFYDEDGVLIDEDAELSPEEQQELIEDVLRDYDPFNTVNS